MIYPGGYKRVRRRNVTKVRRRLERLKTGHGQGNISFAHARSSIASWLGLAKHASAFRLSRNLFAEHDVRNIGKRLLVKLPLPLQTTEPPNQAKETIDTVFLVTKEPPEA